MDWSELVGTKVQLPPPSNELSQSNGQPPAAAPQAAPAAPAPAPAPTAKAGRTTKAAAASRENPLFAGSAAADQAEPPAAPQAQAAPAVVPQPTTVSSLLTVPTLMNLTFATTAITLLWKLLQRWFGEAAGQWVPLVCCLLFAGVSWIASYATARTNTVTKVVTLLVAVLTAFILTAAVIGIDVAVLRPNQ